MKLIFSNLKPFICYVVSVLVYLIAGISEIVSIHHASVCSVIVFIISFMLLGYFNDVKKYIFGFILLELMLAICGWIYLNTSPGEEINRIVPYGNIIHWNYFEFIKNDNVSFISSVVLPVIPISLGFTLNKLIEKKKGDCDGQ